MSAKYPAARNMATHLLRKYKISMPPIDPEAIAKAEEIDVIYADFGQYADKASGLYDFERRRIVINKGIPNNRKTFTIIMSSSRTKL